MRLNQIRDLVAIVNSGSMRSAARALNVAPPVLTRSIRELEQELGVQLLDRTAHGVTPTPAGKAFLSHAHVIQNTMNRIKQETAQHANGGGVVNIGAAGPCEHLLPGALSAFRRQYPTTEVQMVGGTYLAFQSQLRDGRLDFVVSGVPPALLAGNQFKTVLLSREEYVLLARRGHPLRNARSLTQLLDADWIVYGDPLSKWAGPVHDLFAHNQLPTPQSIIRCNDIGMYNALLAGTDLLSLCTRHRLTHGPAHEHFQGLDVEMRRPPQFSVPLAAYHRGDSPLTKPAAALLAAFKSEARRLAGSLRAHPPVGVLPGVVTGRKRASPAAVDESRAPASRALHPG